MKVILQMISVASLAVPACATGGHASYEAMSRDYVAIENKLREQRANAEQLFTSEHLERGPLIRAVLDRNPSVESARLAWRAALARYRQAGALEDPMLMASFAPLSIVSSHAPFGYELGVSQRIPLGGKLDAQSELAAAEARTADSDYADTRVKLALMASELYDDYFVAQRSLEIQAQHVALMDSLKHNALAAYQSGHAAAQDSLQAEAELARLEYQKTVYETQRDVAVEQLNALLHRDPDAALPTPPSELSQREDEAVRAVDKLADVISKRPDVVAARARVEVARAQENVAAREYYPDLTLSTTYNSMWDMAAHRWMAGVSLNVPLQRERRHGAEDEAAAMHAAAESDVQSVTDAARGEAAVAMRRLKEADRAVELYERRLVPVAHERIEVARAGFIGGQSNFMSVIEAARGLRSAELELQMVRADRSKRRAQLERALGLIPGVDASEAKP